MERPNVVFMLADDLGYGDLSCYGASKMNTTNCDQLASEGQLFMDAHSPSAVCTPTRYSILTGRYSWRSDLKRGVLSGYSPPLIEKDRPTIAKFLKEKDYSTACIGKWHLGLGWKKVDGEIDYSQPIDGGPTDLGFDYFFGISASLDMPPYCFIENDQTIGIPSHNKDPVDFSQKDRGGLMTPGWKDEKVNEILTDKATQYIKDHVKQNKDDPFFLYFPLTGPHTPWSPAEAFKGKSKIGARGDMILELDWTVGRIIDTLDSLNIRENTLVILTSDNGPHPDPNEVLIHEHKPAGDFRGQKADIWEGGHRIPLIISWPKRMEKGKVRDELICLVDFFSTCAGLLHDPLPDHVAEDSLDMTPLLLDNEPVRDSVVHHSFDGMFSLRNKEWKLIVGKGSGGFGRVLEKPQLIGLPTQGIYETDEAPGQLYDLQKDYMEKNNRYLENPDIVQDLTGKLIDIINKGDRIYHQEST